MSLLVKSYDGWMARLSSLLRHTNTRLGLVAAFLFVYFQLLDKKPESAEWWFYAITFLVFGIIFFFKSVEAEGFIKRFLLGLLGLFCLGTSTELGVFAFVRENNMTYTFLNPWNHTELTFPIAIGVYFVLYVTRPRS